MKLTKAVGFQIFVVVTFTAIVTVLINNMLTNLIRSGMGIDFSWLMQTSGFALAESSIPYEPSNSYAWALFVGWVNSLKVITFGLVMATFIGVIAGISRISKNPLLIKVSGLYVALIRQVPLLLQLLFWYFVAFLGASEIPINYLGSLISISNQGIKFIGIDISVEFSALLIGLSVFTGASIAEVVRGGLTSIPKGQWEAFHSLGISNGLGIRKIVLPQALPVIIPGLTSQYLNLAKNSTLAIAIGYSDLYAVSDTSITQTGRAIEGFIVLLVSFLMLNLIISNTMELINKVIINPRKS